MRKLPEEILGKLIVESKLFGAGNLTRKFEYEKQIGSFQTGSRIHGSHCKVL